MSHWDLRYVDHGDGVSVRQAFRRLAHAAGIPPQRRIRVVVLPLVTRAGEGAAACALTGLEAIDGIADAGVITDERALSAIVLLSPLTDHVNGLEMRIIEER